MIDLDTLSGLCFECSACSFCCTGSPGYVWLGETDLARLENFLGMERDEFIESYCRWVDTGEGRALSLREKKHYDCIFLFGGKCSVYSARPVQCRTYPFWEEILSSPGAWKAEAASCPGIGKGAAVPVDTIFSHLADRRNNQKIIRPEGDEECPS